MARRNDHSPDELRRLALDAARRLVAEEGLRGLTVRRVAERIGYAPGTLYNLFANLDELVLRLNAETLDRMAEALAAAAACPPMERAAALVEAYFDRIEAEPFAWGVLFEHRLPAGTALPDWYGARLDRLIGIAVAALEPLMTAWPVLERRRAIVAMWAGLHGISTLAVGSKLALVGPGDPRALGRLLVSRVIAAGPP
ncbi:TetR/AcrR family transcriptional regulator [Prosthecomicrobium pneumaticum]|uniref:AcrR family transcriptional regulator n=1 Tax=Prosthecomicrobium pneumaticum TaxID=81895 RepID=A0A7W9FQJ4_9HYPH|nr:TetR/AcrR family transcriptional regulator [Prosthecomicrobium pneumaticum]MBB5755022.1 AcrR family transcriptional regulator [Prosthecomicrobium pneumaticum]